jgi:hypothetical protein
VRVTLAPGILTLAMLLAAWPICDSGCTAKAEHARPMPGTSPVEHEAEQREYERPQALEYDPQRIPQFQPAYQMRRGPLRGDFWILEERKRIFFPR